MAALRGRGGAQICEGDTVKLNIGSGKKRLPGFTNVDAVARDGVDIVATADSIPLPDASVEEILACHIIEHALPWDVPPILAEWHRLLAPGGLLVMEQPDLIKCCQNLIDGVQGRHPDQMGLWGIFGDDRLKDPYMLHRFGYTFASLSKLVAAAGFVNIEEARTLFHRTGRDNRDFRLEARRA